MSWIPSVVPEEAQGDTARVLARLGDRADRPAVNNVWRVLANDPRGMETLLAWRAALVQDPAPLSVTQAMVAPRLSTCIVPGNWRYVGPAHSGMTSVENLGSSS